jgi:hypothetical protein
MLSQIAEAESISDASPGGSSAKSIVLGKLWELYLSELAMGMLTIQTERMIGHEVASQLSPLTLGDPTVRAYEELLEWGHVVNPEGQRNYDSAHDPEFAKYLAYYNRPFTQTPWGHSGECQPGQICSNYIGEGAGEFAHGIVIAVGHVVKDSGENPVVPQEPSKASLIPEDALKRPSPCPIEGLGIGLAWEGWGSRPDLMAKLMTDLGARARVYDELNSIDPEAAKTLLRLYNLAAIPLAPQPEFRETKVWVRGHRPVPGEIYDKEDQERSGATLEYKELLIRQIQAAMQKAVQEHNSAKIQAYRDFGGDPDDLDTERGGIRGAVYGALGRTAYGSGDVHSPWMVM